MRKAFVVPCALLGAALLLSACGSDSNGNDAAPTTVDAASAGLLSSSELTTLVTAAARQRFKVEYRDGRGNTLRYAQDGDGNVMQGTADSETFTTLTTTISCEKSSSTFRCTESPGALGAADTPFTSVVTLLQSYITGLDGKVGQQSTKTIAGRTAQCITFSAADLTGNANGTVDVGDSKVSATYCIDKDTGATVEVSQTDEAGKATTSLVVTTFAAPTAADFEPPATPTPAAG